MLWLILYFSYNLWNNVFGYVKRFACCLYFSSTPHWQQYSGQCEGIMLLCGPVAYVCIGHNENVAAITSICVDYICTGWFVNICTHHTLSLRYTVYQDWNYKIYFFRIDSINTLRKMCTWLLRTGVNYYIGIKIVWHHYIDVIRTTKNVSIWWRHHEFSTSNLNLCSKQLQEKRMVFYPCGYMLHTHIWLSIYICSKIYTIYVNADIPSHVYLICTLRSRFKYGRVEEGGGIWSSYTSGKGPNII